MACRHCGYERGHHRGCTRRRPALRTSKRPREPEPQPTTAADLVQAIRFGLEGASDNPDGISSRFDEAAAEIRCDGGVWLITVKRVG